MRNVPDLVRWETELASQLSMIALLQIVILAVLVVIAVVLGLRLDTLCTTGVGG